jgi:hypothetical protein
MYDNIGGRGVCSNAYLSRMQDNGWPPPIGSHFHPHCTEREHIITKYSELAEIERISEVMKLKGQSLFTSPCRIRQKKITVQKIYPDHSNMKKKEKIYLFFILFIHLF